MWTRTMKYGFSILFVIFLISAIFAGPVYAVSLKSITTWVSGTAIAFIVTGILAISVVAKWTNWLSSIITAFGWLCIVIGGAFDDGKITKEELKEMKEKFTAVRVAARNRPK